MESFYLPREGSNSNHEEAQKTINLVSKLDTDPRVLVVIAHDASLKSQFEYLQVKVGANNVRELKARARWSFLNDFVVAIDQVQ